jgi:signal transduction histidine kinase
VLSKVQRLQRGERWLAWIRLGAIPFAVFQSVVGRPYPPGHEAWAWATTGALAVGGIVLFWLSRKDLDARTLGNVGLAALAFDFAIVSSYVFNQTFQPGTPIRQIFVIVLIEAAFRYGIRGGLALVVASAPVLAIFELLRAGDANERFRYENVTLQLGVEVVVALVVGWLVLRMRGEAAIADARRLEAEALRDELGRKADLLEAANGCARALGSSLELDEAFGAFIGELRNLIPFDRTAIILYDEGRLRVMATAGHMHDEVLGPGEALPEGALIEEVLRTGETVYRRDMSDHLYPEEVTLTSIGLRSRIGTPLLLGTKPIGMVAILRKDPDAFGSDEIELATLLGRLVASAVQNIRAFELERATVEELRRLSALRADFVSLVSHELRSPMAAVIGAARTLQQRWRELSPDQRTSFLALIGDETSRLAILIGDVLDTSRIEAGTFTSSVADVDLCELVRDTVATLSLGQDEVPVVASTPRPVPTVRADRERLKQVVMNLVENAVKYSQAGEEVAVRTWAENGQVLVSVEDTGPGIPREHHGMIFEKFGRANVGGGKPGTGLGLFIARSITEAHGGTLEVRSVPGEGATFTLALPLAKPQTQALAGG